MNRVEWVFINGKNSIKRIIEDNVSDSGFAVEIACANLERIIFAGDIYFIKGKDITLEKSMNEFFQNTRTLSVVCIEKNFYERNKKDD